MATPEFVIERPKNRAQGDFSTNAAMLLAKPAKSDPRAIAQAPGASPSGGVLLVLVGGSRPRPP